MFINVFCSFVIFPTYALQIFILIPHLLIFEDSKLFPFLQLKFLVICFWGKKRHFYFFDNILLLDYITDFFPLFLIIYLHIAFGFPGLKNHIICKQWQFYLFFSKTNLLTFFILLHYAGQEPHTL